MIDPRLRVDLCAAKDESRPVLCQPHLVVTETGEAFFVASDSYRAVRFSVTVEDGETSGPISRDVLEFARRKPGSQIRATAERLIVVDAKGAELASFPRPSNEAEPPWATVFKAAKGDPFTIGLSADLLVGVAEALTGDRKTPVRLDIFGPEQPIHVHSLHGEGLGILMPVRIRE